MMRSHCSGPRLAVRDHRRDQLRRLVSPSADRARCRAPSRPRRRRDPGRDEDHHTRDAPPARRPSKSTVEGSAQWRSSTTIRLGVVLAAWRASRRGLRRVSAAQGQRIELRARPAPVDLEAEQWSQQGNDLSSIGRRPPTDPRSPRAVPRSAAPDRGRGRRSSIRPIGQNRRSAWYGRTGRLQDGAPPACTCSHKSAATATCRCPPARATTAVRGLLRLVRLEDLVPGCRARGGAVPHGPTMGPAAGAAFAVSGRPPRSTVRRGAGPSDERSP